MSSGKKLGLAWQMMIGLVVGIIVGAMVDTQFAQTWFKPLGDLFIRLIRMVVVPLVIATIIAGAAGISDTSKLGRVALKTLLIYAITTAISVAVGLIFASVIQPGVGLDLSTEGLKAKEIVPPPLVDTLLNIVPINPIEAMAKGSMLQIIFFAVMFGFALSALGERAKPVLNFFEVVGDTMIRVTGTVMRFAPIGVFTRRLGATKAISSFSIPLGNTINMNGTAIYMGVCAVFAAEVFGIPMDMTTKLTVVVMGVLAAVGTAGVPGAGLIMTTIVFTQIGIPLEAVALIAGVDRILDMIRTSINVVGDAASAVVVTAMEGELHSEPYEEGEKLI